MVVKPRISQMKTDNDIYRTDQNYTFFFLKNNMSLKFFAVIHASSLSILPTEVYLKYTICIIKKQGPKLVYIPICKLFEPCDAFVHKYVHNKDT